MLVTMQKWRRSSPSEETADEMEAQLNARREADATRDIINDLEKWTAKSRAVDQELIKEKANRDQGSRPKAAPSREAKEESPLPRLTSGTAQPSALGDNASKTKSSIGAPIGAGKSKQKGMKGFLGGSSKVSVPSPVPSSQTAKVSSTPSSGVASPAERVAEGFRQEGNDAFKRGDLKAAEAFYTRSINKCASILALANRAAVFLKTERWEKAERDCTVALGLDQGTGYIKAWQRRGTARRNLGQLLDAAQDFEEALRLEPGNKVVQQERDACLQLWVEQSKPPPPRRHNITVRRRRTRVDLDDGGETAPAAPNVPAGQNGNQPSSKTPGKITRKLERHRPASSLEPDPELLSEPLDGSELPSQPPSIEVIDSYPLHPAEPPEASTSKPADAQAGAAREPRAATGLESPGKASQKAGGGGAANRGLGIPAETGGGSRVASTPSEVGGGAPSGGEAAASSPVASKPGKPAQNGADAGRNTQNPVALSIASRDSLMHLEDGAVVEGPDRPQASQPATLHSAAVAEAPRSGGGQAQAAAQPGDKSSGKGGSGVGGVGVPAAERLQPRPPLEEGVAKQLAALGVGVPQPPGPQQGQGAVAGSRPAAVKAMGVKAGGIKRRPPTTGTEFEQVWRGLKHNREEQAAYVKVLEPSSLPGVLKHSLTPPVLASLAVAALTDMDQKSLKVLLELPHVPRFGVTLAMMSARQKQDLAEAWAVASRSSNAIQNATLEGLRLLFCI